jgi:predicted dehydrogenase
MHTSACRLDRRRFVAGAAALPAACGLPLPALGAFAAGTDRLRVGLVGCGGRGTGAALDALASAPGVAVVAMADAFGDQIESSAALLAARAARGFDCPPQRRYAGPDAWRQVVESDLDLVILATPPAFRPLQAAAAVRAGRHVWCETPGAVDASGVGVLAEAVAEAATRGLSFASGLARRHDAFTTAVVERIHAGTAGRPLAATVHADLGLPWCKPAQAGWTAADVVLRNWIRHDHLSGGPFVERHVAAIDMALWALGDEDPVGVVPGAAGGGVRYLLADGRHVDATLRRRSGATGRVEEFIRTTSGVRDLRRPASAPNGDRHPLRVAMADLVGAIRSGGRLDHGPWLRRATLAAVAGRTVLRTGTALAWSDLPNTAARPARPLQSSHS